MKLSQKTGRNEMNYHSTFLHWTEEIKSVTNKIKVFKNTQQINNKEKYKLDRLIRRKMKLEGSIKGYKLAQGFYQRKEKQHE